MAEASVAGIGRLTRSRRERTVVVEPRGTGMALFTLRAEATGFGNSPALPFSAEELRALDVDSSKVIDLETFVSRGDIDPVYFDTPYYLYPDLHSRWRRCA